MPYVSADDRTQILLEAIEDASAIVGDITPQHNDAGTAILVRESQAHRLVTAFHLILAAAKRHPDWPDTQRKQDEERAAREKHKAIVAATPRPEVEF